MRRQLAFAFDIGADRIDFSSEGARMRGGTLAMALVLSASAVAHPGAQTGSQSGTQSTDARPSNERGQLVVWRIVDTSSPRPFTPASLDPQVKSQTAGSFGQTSGSFGQTSASTGQTASSLGQPSSNTGQTAGSVGTTAGNFGESLGSLAGAAERSNGSAGQTRADPNWDRFTQSARSQFRSLNIVYEDVGIDELESKLRDRSPDLVVGTPLPSSWANQESGLVRRYGLITLGLAEPFPQEDNAAPAAAGFKVQASILRAARNPKGSRAFLLWLYDKELCTGCERISAQAQTPAMLAKSALYSTLSGQRLGITADRQAAPFNAALAQRAALNLTAPSLTADLKITVEVTGAAANERFAYIALSAVIESNEAFGVVHASVVLRTDDSGKWHVLQITPNLPLQQQSSAFTFLRPYGAIVAPETVAKVLGASLAAPEDGDNREASPELWWDNHGGATLEIVEWQRKIDVSSTGPGWTLSNLFYVPDDNGHLRTRVTGRFASSPGPYRWRLWSVGRGGTVVISPWRSLNIIAH